MREDGLKGRRGGRLAEGENVLDFSTFSMGCEIKVLPKVPLGEVLPPKSSFSGEEETFGVESFERNLRYSPHEVDRQHFAVRTFEEKFPLGGDGADSVKSGGVRFEDLSESVYEDEEASGRGETNHLLRRSPHLETTQLRIPRVQIGSSVERGLGKGCSAERGGRERHSPSSPSSCHSFGGDSVAQRRLPLSSSTSPHSFAGTYLQNVPMKKVVRRSRLVSIHDGRPMDEGRGRSSSSTWRTNRDLWDAISSSSCSLSSNDERETNAGMRARGGDAEWAKKTGVVQLQHNPLFYDAGRRF
uniref:Uncharacterized protein n=1 Tax=Globodera rostochiensis TaxID=31243 RepID=A0A914HGL8_GLORO